MLKSPIILNFKRTGRHRRLVPGKRRSLCGSANATRDGAAAVEAAFCIPVVIILMLGTLEICSGIYLSESLTVSAYESCRAGIRRRSTANDVYERAVQILAERNVTLSTGAGGQPVGITVQPANFSGLKALDPVTVTITAPTTGNSMFIFDTLYNRNVTVSVSMVREFDN